MKTAQVVLGVGIAAAIGGAIYLSQKKKEDSQPTVGPPPNGAPPPLPSYIPQVLVDAYTKCYESGCTPQEYLQVQSDLYNLTFQHPEAVATWTYFAEELAKKYNPTTVNSGPQLPTDYSIKMTYQPSVDKCYSYNCTYADVYQLLSNLQSVYFQHVLDHPSVANGIGDVMRYLRDAYGIAQPGTQGRHTGGCSCQARQEVIGTGACCDACERGEECTECGEHKPAVG